MGQEIVVTVDKKGNTKIEAVGFVGESCGSATKFLEDSLGKVKKEELKTEFYQQESEENKLYQKI